MSRKFGLLPIYNCDNSNRSGDIIFVHGLGDHPIKAWYPNPKEIEEEVDTEKFWNNKLPTLDFWLNWLSKDRPDLGIWSYSYEAMPFKTNPVTSNLTDIPAGQGSPIFDHASEFLKLLEQKQIRQKPRIFVTHSLGGLIVKEILR